MLHAELHGKLDPSSPELERREDILTSTVFGTLLVAGATDLLVEWLNSARRLGEDGELRALPMVEATTAPIRTWFWPDLFRLQPDVLIQIGRQLIVVEAKYGASKGGSRSSEEAQEDRDQLVRQWLGVQPDSPSLEWYSPAIREAIQGCEVHLAYLVSARRRARALIELRESQSRIRSSKGRDGSLWLLTWQDLHQLLKRDSMELTPAAGWRRDLARLLERRGLHGFLGFRHVLAPKGSLSKAPMVWAREWQRSRLAALAEAFEEIDLARLHAAVMQIEEWSAGRGRRSGVAAEYNFVRVLAGVDTTAIKRTSTGWSRGLVFNDRSREVR